MRSMLNLRDATNLSKLRRYLVAMLDVGGAETINEVLYVDGTNGNDANDGKSPDMAKKTIQAALTASVAYGLVAVFPGTYAEHLTMAVANVSLLGLGDAPQDVLLYSTVDDATAMVAITASGCKVANLRISLGHANNVSGLTIAASNCIVSGCEFVKAAAANFDRGVDLIGPNTNVKNKIVDCLFDTCIVGIQFVTSATAQSGAMIHRCVFKGGTTADINDGGAAVDVLLVDIRNCDFIGAPTDFIVLTAGDSTGALVGCRFAYATFEADVIAIDAGILPVDCHTVAGEATAVPG